MFPVLSTFIFLIWFRQFNSLHCRYRLLSRFIVLYSLINFESFYLMLSECV